MNKVYTSLEQSKKLAEILPPESVDAIYYYHPKLECSGGWYEFSYGTNKINHPYDIPCWSLTALYGILPNNEKESTTLSRGGWEIEPPKYIDNWWCEYEDDNHIKDFTVSADNPVDACYKMILKLNELNLL